MDASVIKLGDAFVHIGANIAPLKDDLNKVYNTVYSFGNKLQEIGKKAATSWAAKFTTIIAATKVFAALGDNLDKMALRAGIASQTLSEMDFALSQCGTNLETFEHAAIARGSALRRKPPKIY